MRKQIGNPALPLVALVVFAFTPARANAAELNVEMWEFLRHLPTHHLLFLAAIFVLIGLWARSRESSMVIVLGSFLLAAISLGSFLIFTLTGDLMNKGLPSRAYERLEIAEVKGGHAATPAEIDAAAAAANRRRPPAAATPAPAKTTAQVGAECKKAANCGGGSQCAKVAGSRHCWMPCAPDGSCDPGYACMIPVSGPKVCVK